MTIHRKRDWVWDHTKFKLPKFIIPHVHVPIPKISFSKGIPGYIVIRKN